MTIHKFPGIRPMSRESAEMIYEALDKVDELLAQVRADVEAAQKTGESMKGMLENLNHSSQWLQGLIVAVKLTIQR